MFHIGYKVKVINEYDEYYGNEGVIEEIEEDSAYYPILVVFPEGYWVFDEEELELVEESQ